MGVRSSGILLHPSCLPSAYGIGDLGPSAYRFADFLKMTGQRLWQMLPLNPTAGAHGHSPYHSPSAFAGDPLLISPQLLMQQGWLKKAELALFREDSGDRIAFDRVIRIKRVLLHQACRRFDKACPSAFQRFSQQADWLDDFALFAVLRSHFHPRPWYQWPLSLRDREPRALGLARRRFARRIHFQKILQYFFWRQWAGLRRYCHQRQIRLIGDMPIYAPLDSVDVWSHPQLFKLTPDGRPAAVSGVPPDYFSASGQLWGHPVYDWQALQAAQYGWWIARMQQALRRYDLTRIDHFRGLVACWEIPAGAKTAAVGHWVKAPVIDFFDRLIQSCGPLPVIAEDLGDITPDVREVMRRYGFPGMRVLLFAFGDDFPNGPFLPHRHGPDCVVYTGTHDNNTIRGWFETEAGPQSKKNLLRYLGRDVAADALHWEVIRLAMMSTADTVIVPLQDVLGLGAEARMNRPASRRGNWLWRFGWEMLDSRAAEQLGGMTATYGRI